MDKESFYINKLPDDNDIPQRDDVNTPEVRRLFSLVDNNWQDATGDGIINVYENRYHDYAAITYDYLNAFSTSEPEGMYQLYSKATFNTIKKANENIQVPSYDIKFKKNDGDISFEENRYDEIIVKKAIEYSLRECGYFNALEGKGGTFQSMFMHGDGFPFISTNLSENEFPFTVTNFDKMRIFVNGGALAMRGATPGKNVRKFVAVIDYDDYDSFISDWGEYKEVKRGIKWGDLPFSVSDDNFLLKHHNRTNDRPGQVALFFDLDDDLYMVLAGTESTIIDKQQGKNYPFKLKRGDYTEKYIPFFQFMCFQSVSSFWNFGIGHYMSAPNRINDYMLNKNLINLQRNVDKLELWNIKQGSAEQVQNRIYQAQKSGKEGGSTIVLQEHSPDEQNPMIGTITQLNTDNSLASSAYREWKEGVLEDMVLKMGINPNDIAGDPNKTATQVASEQQASTSFIHEIVYQNIPNFKFLIEVIIDYMKKHISKKNKTQLDMSDFEFTNNEKEETAENVMQIDKEQRAEQGLPEMEPEKEIVNKEKIKGEMRYSGNVTLGEAIKVLKERGDVEVNIQFKTGVKPNAITDRLNLQNLIQFAPTPDIGMKLTKKLYDASNVYLSDDDYKPQEPPPQQLPQEPPQGQPPPGLGNLI